MYKDHRITIIIPCLNDDSGIGQVLDDLPPFVDETVVVGNNSAQQTANAARSRGAIFVGELKRGYGLAYKEAFSYATGDIIIALDGDHSYPPDALSYLLEAFLSSRVGFLSASRFPTMSKHSMSPKHKVGNKVLSLIMSVLYFRWINDSQSGMWVFRRNLLPKMKLTSDGLAFSEEIKIEAIRNPDIGFREIYIDYSQRIGEKQLQPWSDGFRNLTFLLKKRFL